MCDNPETEALDLESLANGRPGITPKWGAVLVETAVVCFEDQQHASGVELRVRCHADRTFTLNWQRIVDDQMRRCYNDSRKTTEFGAEGIAILVVEVVTGLTVVERSDTGTHIDFWLGEDDDDAPPFASEARLEISGIRRGDDTKIAARVKEKQERLKGADSLLPAFIIVVEFSAPVCEVQQR